jgi:hypothetical protein
METGLLRMLRILAMTFPNSPLDVYPETYDLRLSTLT